MGAATAETALSASQLTVIGMPTGVVEMATAMIMEMVQTPAHGAAETRTKVQAPLLMLS